jgi:hypothetical protein
MFRSFPEATHCVDTDVRLFPAEPDWVGLGITVWHRRRKPRDQGPLDKVAMRQRDRLELGRHRAISGDGRSQPGRVQLRPGASHSTRDHVDVRDSSGIDLRHQIEPPRVREGDE